ncbi:MAG: tyrosine--tRNA ligase [Gammaproteobacteria bacterium]|nr:tyrosine--tRNA ligase [Gammaproteobacteria bacterium]
MSAFLDTLQWRGLLHQTAGADIEQHLARGGRVAYCGFDPTASSLTVGNFNSINLLRHWQRSGNKPIVVMGGGTGLIGDPSGKDSERQLLTADDVAANVEGQRGIFERILDFDPANPNCAVIVNNHDWLGKLGYIEMLRDVGKYFSVNAMIQKESVRERLHNRDQGISYTEFSYMLLQAYDFYHLRVTHDCTVQLAGSDQYGNIVAGMDLIRRRLGSEQVGGYGVTSPLVTRADGKKFGKSEQGAVWLTADRTSAYAFYQFWLNTEDAMVLDYLRRFTLLPRAAVDDLSAQHEAAPHQRAAHRALARELTELLHGTDQLSHVEHASEVLFGGGDLRSVAPELLRDMFADVPHSSHGRDQLGGAGVPLADILAQTSLASSKRQAREHLASGAVAVNGQRVDADYQLTGDDLLGGGMILLRRGKKSWHATRWD